MENNRVLIFDTTSRDGKQSPGCNHSPDDTVAIGRQLVRTGVDIMEAGFPIASDYDFEATRRVATEVEGITCCALARTVGPDILRAGEALEKALQPPRIHVFIGSSDEHMGKKLRMDPEQVIEQAVGGIELALRHVGDVEFSPEDASRTGLDFLVQIVKAAIDAGAKTINVPDTVGYAVGGEYGSIFAHLIKTIPEVTDKGIILSAHCHNDLGCAVANTLSAVENGARQIECTVSGIGERAGNTGLEPTVMALRLRQAYYGVTHGIVTEELGPTARLVSLIIGKPIYDTAPVVGANVFAHGSGIHQDGVLKSAGTYEIMTPKSVGWKGQALPLTSSSGKAGLNARLKSIGYELASDELVAVYEIFTALADTKQFVFDSDLHMLMQEFESASEAESKHWIRLERVDYHKVGGERSVTVHLSTNSDVFEASGTGNGPVSATWAAVENALRRKDLWPGDVLLTNFDVGKGQGGVKALGLALIQIELGDQVAFGRGSGTDIIEAYALAEVAAVNHLRASPIQKAILAT